MIRKRDLIFVQDSRSYGGIKVPTDHKMVKARCKVEFFRLKTEKHEAGIDVHRLKDVENQKKYKEAVQNKLQNVKENEDLKEKWSNTAKVCLEAAEEVVGRLKRGKQCQDLELEKLSKIQKKLRNDIEASKNKRDRENLKKQRNEIMNKIHRRKSKIEREKITEKIEEIENHTLKTLTKNT